MAYFTRNILYPSYIFYKQNNIRSLYPSFFEIQKNGILPKGESRPFVATVAINIGRYVSAAVINTILVIGRRSTIRTDGQSGYRRDAIGCIRVARGGTRGQSTG